MDLDLRKLRYFVAVAEHLNFGRAAEQLHIAQPVLSRQIRALEQELKVTLFVRGNRGTELTTAGQALLEDARQLLSAAEGVRRRVHDAATGRRTFTVGFVPGLVVTDAVRQLSQRRPELSVEVFRTDWYDQTEAILDGRVDVGYVRRPFNATGLDIDAFAEEPRVVALPVEHRLAGKTTMSVTDLAEEHLLQDPDVVPEWRDIATELRASGPRRVTPRLRTVEEKLEHVARGNGVVVLPASTAAFYTRRDVTHVLVDDIGPSQVCLAWDSRRRSPLVSEFVAIALACRAQTTLSAGPAKVTGCGALLG
jgi:DNA-binding transcriptional LysR family regulator